MDTYNKTDKMVKNTVHCNEYSTSKLANFNGNMKMRFEYDNRIPIAGVGMVNFGFNQNFVVNGGIINGTDDRVLSILKDNEIVGYRYIRDNGNWFVTDTEE